MRLGVNIDHIATLRNARGGMEPGPAVAAGIAELAGADLITCHLREDRRHIKESDVYAIKSVLTTRLNLEMSINKEVVDRALEIVPHQATLVPENRKEITTEGGLDVIKFFSGIKDVIKELHRKNIEVSLFIDPDIKQIEKVLETGAKIIEIHTGRYSNLFIRNRYQEELKKIKEMSKIAYNYGIQVAAGHGLNYVNTGLIASIPEIEELNIGHSIISRAVFVGLRNAVKEMKEIINHSIRV